jgi:hypothetical protein
MIPALISIWITPLITKKHCSWPLENKKQDRWSGPSL